MSTRMTFACSRSRSTSARPRRERVVHRPVHEHAAAQVEGRHRDAGPLALADVRAAAGLAGRVVERAAAAGGSGRRRPMISFLSQMWLPEV